MEQPELVMKFLTVLGAPLSTDPPEKVLPRQLEVAFLQNRIAHRNGMCAIRSELIFGKGMRTATILGCFSASWRFSEWPEPLH